MAKVCRVSNPWREAIEGIREHGECSARAQFPILGGRLLKLVNGESVCLNGTRFQSLEGGY